MPLVSALDTKCDERPLLNFALDLNLRRYSWDYTGDELTINDAASTYVRRLVVDKSG